MNSKQMNQNEGLKREGVMIYGYKISYLTAGDEKSPPLIFLHGVFASSALYRRFLNILSKKFRVYAVDVPGFGMSSMPRNILIINDFTDIICKFIKTLNIKKPIIMGHSAGGLITIDIALNHKEIPKKIVFINAAGLKLKYNFRELYLDLILKAHLNQLWRYHLWREAGIIVSDFIRGALTPAYWKILKHDSFVNYEGEFKKIKIPTLLLWGKKDHLFPVSYAKKFHKLIPKSRLIFLDGDHDWPVIHPKETYKIIDKI
jgi:pimeloyl-ACP methyl ester carboxylesterase